MRFLLCVCLLAACAAAALTMPNSSAQAASKPIVVAIVDTGVTARPALAARLLPGWDFVDGDANAADLNGHGTELASIVEAQCPRCQVLPVRVLGQGGLGSVPTVIQGIQWAVAHGADVVNLSLTTPSDNPDLTAAIEWAVGQGVTTVLAAGNRGVSAAYPGMTAPDAIAVGSVDAQGNPFSWSNFGPWVDVVAPGTLSALSMQGRRVSAVGTSASAAYVAGAAGLLLGCDRTLAPAAVSSRLVTNLSAPTC